MLNPLVSSKIKTKPAGKPVMRAVKALLHHLDGSTSEMVLITPIYGGWSDPIEIAQSLMKEYIQRMTQCFIGITSFETQMGSITPNGEFRGFCSPLKHEIPLNKVFISGKPGHWVDPNDHLAAMNADEKGGVSCQK